MLVTLLMLYNEIRVFDFRSRGLQPLHLSLAARIRGRRADADVSTVRQRDQFEGVHRPGDQSEQMLW